MKRLIRFRNFTALFMASLLLVPALASAHVIVTPGQVGVAAEQIFSVSVPNEKDTPVTQVKLLIPAGVQEIIPTEKDGWTIQLTKQGSSDDAPVTAITWTGTIPVGYRDDFSFNAQVPGKATQLDWKAYQTYGDGSVVHWDQTPAGSDDATGDAGPYSITKVTNDLATAAAPAKSSTNGLTLIIALVAIVLSAAALLRRPSNKA